MVLAACAKPAPTRLSFRDAGLSLYSNAVFERDRMFGDWVQVAAFAPSNAGGCHAGTARFAPQGDRVALQANLCLSGEAVAYTGVVSFIEAGRMVLSGADPAGIGQEWWVVWVDVDYRTMVIGTPSGDFGFILNRDGRLPADRLAAAREILEWNGYNLAKLRNF